MGTTKTKTKSAVLPTSLICGNLYFIKEAHIDGGKHLYHNIIVALFTDSMNISDVVFESVMIKSSPAINFHQI